MLCISSKSVRPHWYSNTITHHTPNPPVYDTMHTKCISGSCPAGTQDHGDVDHQEVTLVSLMAVYSFLLILLQVTIQLTFAGAVLEKQVCPCLVVVIQIWPESWQP